LLCVITLMRFSILLLTFLIYSGDVFAAKFTCRDLSEKPIKSPRAGGRNRIPDERVIEMLQYIGSIDQKLLRSNVFETDPDGSIEKALSKKFGYKSKPSSLSAVVRKRWTWEGGLRRAGFDPEEISYREWSEKQTIAALTEMQRVGIEIRNPKFVVEDSRTEGILTKIRKSPFRPESFYAYVLRNYTDWPTALDKLGFSNVDTYSEDFMNKALVDLKKLGVNVENPKTMVRDPKTKKYLVEKVGAFFSPETFYQRISRKYHKWNLALTAFGLSNKVDLELNRENLIMLIQKIHDAGFQLNYNSLLEDHGLKIYQYLTSNNIVHRRASTILIHAKAEFGSWDEALIAAGYNPDEIRLHGTAPYRLLSDALKAQRSENTADWLPGRKIYKHNDDGSYDVEVVANVDLEAELITREQQQAVDGAIMGLSSDERKLFAVLVRVYEEKEIPLALDASLADQSIELITEYSGSSESAASLQMRITALMKKLTSNSQLRNAILD
jgi:hypothetical protein